MDITYSAPNILFMEEEKMKKISSHWEIKYVTKNGKTSRELIQVHAMPDNVHFLGVRMERAKFTPYATVAFAFEAEAKSASTKSASTKAIKAKTNEETDKNICSIIKNLKLVEQAYFNAVEAKKQEINDDNAELLEAAVIAAHDALEAALATSEGAMEAVDAKRLEAKVVETEVPAVNDEVAENAAATVSDEIVEVDSTAVDDEVTENDSAVADDEAAETDVVSENSGNAGNESNYTSKLAEEYSLSVVEWDEFGIYSNENGEFFVFVPDTEDPSKDCFFSLAPITRKTGEAFTGEKPLAGIYSPDDFAQLLNAMGAKVPTKRQFENFVTLLNSATGSNTAIGLMRAVLGSISVTNQLVFNDDNGRYSTYMGEYPYILRDTALNNLACHKVFN